MRALAAALRSLTHRQVRSLTRAAALKAEYAVERRHANPPLERRTLAMLSQRPSLRTRVTFDVMDGGRSIIFDQSEYRLHAQKGPLVELLGG